MSKITSPLTHLIPLDCDVPDFAQEFAYKLKGAKIVVEKLDIDMDDAPACTPSELPDKEAVEEEAIIIPTKVHKKQTKKKTLF